MQSGNTGLSAQQSFEVIVFVDSVRDSKLFAKVRDSVELQFSIVEWIKGQRKDGFLLSGLDSIVKVHLHHTVFLHRGKRFTYLVIAKDTTTEKALGVIQQKLPDGKFNPEEWDQKFNEWIHLAAESSYPFAKVQFAPVEIRGDTLIAIYQFLTNGQIFFGQTDQRQKKLLDNRILSRMINIRPGDPYNHKLVEGIQDKLGRLQYVQMRSAPRVLFLGNEAFVWLYLEKAKANKFDILLGLNPETGLSGRKYRLTGEAGFEIYNTLKSGEKIFLKYENLIENSPKLKIGLDFPYITFLPFGIAADFLLHRFGEQYIDLSAGVVFSYPWSLYQKSGISFTYKSSSILNPDSLTLNRTGRLPAQLDYDFYTAGIQHEFNNLDYLVNPTKGWQLFLDVRAGMKKFKENNILLDYESDLVHVQQQYDSLNLNGEQAVYSLNGAKYFKLETRQVIKLSLNATGLLSAGVLLDNELIRIGGYKNLRGFDEDFYKCSHAIVQTVEYRFLLDRNSFINVFSDFAFLKQPVNDKFEWNWYEGFGLGIQFQTKIGAFSLQYALGTSKAESVNLGKGKVHFGYATLF